jgi:hypothetical protein
VSDDPETMLERLAESGQASGRKLQLFAAACCRRIWHLLTDPRSRHGVELLERFADGLAAGQDVRGVLDAAAAASREAPEGARSACDAALAAAALMKAEPGSSLEQDTAATVVMAAGMAVEDDVTSRTGYQEGLEAMRRESAAQAGLVRCIFGDPSSPPALDTVLPRSDIIRGLARAAYAERVLPQGELDPARLAVLADALEEVGCPDAGPLGHLRSPGPHVRGCFALDAVFGKT